MKCIIIDASRKVLIEKSAFDVALRAVNEFIRLAKEALKNQASFSSALSGGSTPKKMYEELVKNKEALQLNFSQMNFFWSDERIVPPDNPESNYGMAMHYFSKSPFDQVHAFRMKADATNLDQAAAEYAKEIEKHCFQKRFDLMLLGIGDDGHTASLFPYTKALQEEQKLVCSNFVPAKSCYRLTLTYRAIHEAKETIVLVTGETKAKVLQEIFYGKKDFEKYPAQKIGTAERPALFIIDEAAARLLSPT